eukprot:CAMPEP_0119363120 /NCGR_PEP_ID=MMETSP1334-20130426/9993_1 /TAXON_ID=127549 /ORGANISM="Calcidiscus leptoporus, Strain RCC1130" /LENGTH=85 /DNA_ID=CAMNT_0007378461 /DNA_START=61 /DNA_END=315 /DNA_ORIENTATION=-
MVGHAAHAQPRGDSQGGERHLPQAIGRFSKPMIALPATTRAQRRTAMYVAHHSFEHTNGSVKRRTTVSSSHLFSGETVPYSFTPK